MAKERREKILSSALADFVFYYPTFLASEEKECITPVVDQDCFWFRFKIKAKQIFETSDTIKRELLEAPLTHLHYSAETAFFGNPVNVFH